MDHVYWPSSSSSNGLNYHEFVVETGSDPEPDGSLNEGDSIEDNKPLAMTSILASTNNETKEIHLQDGIIVNYKIHNMLCNYTLPMHIDLTTVAFNSINVDYDRVKGVLIKQLRNPPCCVKIYNSGKIVIVKCKSEEDCRRASRSIGRMVQKCMNKLDQKIYLRNYRVSNILATCRMPFGVRIVELANKYRREGAIYEPELMVGLEWAFKEPKANLRIYTTGTINITGVTSEVDLVKSIQKVYPYLKEFACHRGNNLEDLNDEDEFTLASNRKTRRRQHPQQSKKKAKNGTNNGYKRAKKQRVGDIDGTGMYNNQMYFSDEDDDYMEEDDGHGGTDEDEDF